MVIDSRRSTPSSKAVRTVKGRDLSHALRPETGARPVGRAGVVGRPEHGHVVVAAAADVFAVGRLQEGVDAGVVRQLTPAEGRDPLVDDGVGARQPELEAPGDLGLPLCRRDAGLGLEGAPRFGAVTVVHVVSCHLRFVI